ncbi:MAG: S-layer homology domain-containing protein [Patescibacteria group bacterium]
MKKIIALIIGLIATSSITAFATFKDVGDDTGYQTSIYWMQENEVINGYADGSFKPDQAVTRAEFLKMLFKTLETETTTPTIQTFKDVAIKDWSAPYILTAKNKGTVQGYAGNLFKPNQSVTRGEAIKMATLEFNGGKIPTYVSYFEEAKDFDPASWYLDYDATAWHNEYFLYVLATGTVGMNHTKIGDPNGFHYYPNQAMTRKEVAEMLYRMKVVKDNGLSSYSMGYPPKDIIAKTNSDLEKLDIELHAVSYDYNDSSVAEAGDHITFDFYINRVDLGVTENYSTTIEESGTMASLSASLQTKEIYLTETGATDESSHITCINTYYPHGCTVEVNPTKDEYNYDVVVEFKDGVTARKSITIKKPEGLSRPTISFPSTNPAQNSKLKVTFADVGADKYIVTARNCHEYENNGINPCLEEIVYTLTRVGNSFNVNFMGEAEDDADYPKVVISNGSITVSSNFVVNYGSGVEYWVEASITNTVDNIKNTTTNYAYKGLYINTPTI